MRPSAPQPHARTAKRARRQVARGSHPQLTLPFRLHEGYTSPPTSTRPCPSLSASRSPPPSSGASRPCRAQPRVAELRLLRRAGARRERRPLPRARGGLDHLLPRPFRGRGRTPARHSREPDLRPGQPIRGSALAGGCLRLGQAVEPAERRGPGSRALYWGLPSRSPDPRAGCRLHRRHRPTGIASRGGLFTNVLEGKISDVRLNPEPRVPSALSSALSTPVPRTARRSSVCPATSSRFKLDE